MEGSEECTRTRKMKIRPRKRRKGFWDFEVLSEIFDEVFSVAMQSGIRSHPPIAHKRSISMNHLHTSPGAS